MNGVAKLKKLIQTWEAYKAAFERHNDVKAMMLFAQFEELMNKYAKEL